MTDQKLSGHREILKRIAYRAMVDRGLEPDFSAKAQEELLLIEKEWKGPSFPQPRGQPRMQPLRDLRNLPWASIDNDESRDLDQLTVAETLPDGAVRILVAVADVDAIVKKDSAIDARARDNTTSVYTPAKIFHMLPERLSTDLTSLNFQEDRLAIIIEMVLQDNGTTKSSDIYGGWVRNWAKLSYSSVGAWLERKGPLPNPVAAVKGLDENLRLQDRMAREMRKFRHECGALDLDTFQPTPVFRQEEIRDLKIEPKNRARELIEDFMIAANSTTARFLEGKRYPSFRRIVRSPKRWARIVEIASECGFKFPSAPDSRALSRFLARQRVTDPLRFPDLSLSIIKLLGPGEYVAGMPGEQDPGHFGLAVSDYSHSTAPNRRFADLLTQRILKAALSPSPVPYEPDQLRELARHCTQREDDAKKIERQLTKVAACLLLSRKIGQRFDGIITGAAEKGTWVRIFHPPVEGKLVEGFQGVDVGQRLCVQLIYTDAERGFIDFKRV